MSGTDRFDNIWLTPTHNLVFMLVETAAPEGFVLPTGDDARSFFVLAGSPANLDDVNLALGIGVEVEAIADNITVFNTPEEVEEDDDEDEEDEEPEVPILPEVPQEPILPQEPPEEPPTTTPGEGTPPLSPPLSDMTVEELFEAGFSPSDFEQGPGNPFQTASFAGVLTAEDLEEMGYGPEDFGENPGNPFMSPPLITTENPQTGDGANMLFLIASGAAVVASGIALGIVIKKRKNRQEA